MKSQPKVAGDAASRLITEKIAELGDWRGDTLARMRGLIKEADPDVVEEWTWMGTPVWSHDGGICTGETYKSIVKLTFFKGASLKDPAKLSTRALTGTSGVPSTFTRVKRLTRTRSRRSSARPSLSILPAERSPRNAKRCRQGALETREKRIRVRPFHSSFAPPIATEGGESKMYQMCRPSESPTTRTAHVKDSLGQHSSSKPGTPPPARRR